MFNNVYEIDELFTSKGLNFLIDEYKMKFQKMTIFLPLFDQVKLVWIVISIIIMGWIMIDLGVMFETLQFPNELIMPNINFILK